MEKAVESSVRTNPALTMRGGCWAIQGNVFGRAPENGPGGCGYSDAEVAYTLNTIDRMAVCVTMR